VIFLIVKWVDRYTGLTGQHLIGNWPSILQVLFFLVTHDCYIYWFHRWQHHSKDLWRIHEAHHSTVDVDWLSGARSHSVEILINQTIEYAPIVLLGAAPEMILIKGIIDAVWGMYIHSNIDVHSGALQCVINGPEMHRRHHAREITEGGINFSTKLAFWDWMFGTTYLPRPKKPSGYGIIGVDFPSDYVSQHLFAFRPFQPARNVDTAGTDGGG
jgi:sterol desaturase/sphingolipid hydroxylase (fatty acid hydroxylase superfamily)